MAGMNPLIYSTKENSFLFSHFQTNDKDGLSTSSLKNIRSIYGFNELKDPESESLFSKLKEQLSDVLVIILLIAALISFLTNIFAEKSDDVPPWIEPSVIFLILIMNAVIGIYQDYNAENALKALNQLNISSASVLRDGIWLIVPSKELVPGDIIKVLTGSKVPADLRILSLESLRLQVNQSIFTGESSPVDKDDIKLSDNTDLSIFEMKNLLFSGSLIVQGCALTMVIATGESSQIGRIQKDVIEAQSQELVTPLKAKLNEFGDHLAKAIGILCLVIWLLNIGNFLNHGNFLEGALYYFKIAVSLAVAAIPEGLPAVITTCLALGTRRMAKRNALVRNLTSVETLGCTTVICTDKTGTLTTNEMCVKRFCLFMKEKNNSELISPVIINVEKDDCDEFIIKDYQVEGFDYSLEGGIPKLSKGEFQNNLRLLCQCMAICNDSRLIYREEKRKDIFKRKVSVIGLPLEGALRVLVEKIGKFILNDSGYLENELEAFSMVLKKNFINFKTIEFTSDRKMMTVICEDSDTNTRFVFIKGAPEILLDRSHYYLDQDGNIIRFSPLEKEIVNNQIKDYSSQGLRCLGLAYKTLEKDEDLKILMKSNFNETIENHLNFIGLVAMEDPPRPEVKESIELCRRAGIKIIMATGDLKETAQSIATQLGLLKSKKPDNYCYSGRDMELMSPSEQDRIIEDFLKGSHSMIFYRLEPRHKRMLVNLLNQKSQIVAMTGDGVNDAPALRQADIGIAMGLSGTEVAKEAADMILADDNFGTIVVAIEEGRAIFNNMKAFIRYMISSNIGEVGAIFMASILGIPDIFSSVQLLWVNLVTDGLPAMALSFNKPDSDIMNRKPRSRSEALVTQWIFFRYMIVGCYVGLATTGIFIYWYLFYDFAEDTHTLISYSQLSNWTECPSWEDFSVNSIKNFDFSSNSCNYFTNGKKKASSLSLTTLVLIEMFNSLNALSEELGLLDVGLMANVWLIIAVFLSVIMHACILYIPALQLVFQTTELSLNDWMIVVGFSFPVILIDEIVKYVARASRRNEAENGNNSSKTE